MEGYKGKAIYNPKGKAGEYSGWACNFYVGCSNGCEYCYLKKGRGKSVLGGDVPTLKKHFKNEEHALEIFKKEAIANKDALQKNGLFFSFTTDPMLPETRELTEDAIGIAQYHGIPCKVLTKMAGWVDAVVEDSKEHGDHVKGLIAYGFTLTGFDEREPNASSNIARIQAMSKLHQEGFKVWASIEPVIDLSNSFAVINLSRVSCDLFKIGLMAGKKYKQRELEAFVGTLTERFPENKFYFKDTLLKQAGIDRASLPGNCVSRDYNIFTN